MTQLLATQADFIISDCATCLHTLREYRDLLGSDQEAWEAARKAAPMVQDLSQLLVQDGLCEPAGRIQAHPVELLWEAHTLGAG